MTESEVPEAARARWDWSGIDPAWFDFWRGHLGARMNAFANCPAGLGIAQALVALGFVESASEAKRRLPGVKVNGAAIRADHILEPFAQVRMGKTRIGFSTGSKA